MSVPEVIKTSLDAGQRLTKAREAQRSFHNGKNRKADPYQLALDVQIAERQRQVAAADARGQITVIDGGKR